VGTVHGGGDKYIQGRTVPLGMLRASYTYACNRNRENLIDSLDEIHDVMNGSRRLYAVVS